MSDAQTPKTDATVINGWLDVNEWRQRAMHYEYQWSNCSPCCAGLQGRAERAESALAADRKSTRLNSSHMSESRMPSSA